jgi:hypothetical protein
MKIQRIDHVGMIVIDQRVTRRWGYKLCYVRGPEGIILEVAEQIK